MNRRQVLKLGLGGSILVIVGGAVATRIAPGMVNGRLSETGSVIFRIVGRAVLDGSLSRSRREAETQLDEHMKRLNDTLAGLPMSTQAEVSQLLALLATAPGRRLLAGMSQPWDQAGISDVQSALQSMRLSQMSVRQQIYHALRDLTNAAFYSDASSWPQLGYPGPRAL